MDPSSLQLSSNIKSGPIQQLQTSRLDEVTRNSLLLPILFLTVLFQGHCYDWKWWQYAFTQNWRDEWVFQNYLKENLNVRFSSILNLMKSTWKNFFFYEVLQNHYNSEGDGCDQKLFKQANTHIQLDKTHLCICKHLNSWLSVRLIMLFIYHYCSSLSLFFNLSPFSGNQKCQILTYIESVPQCFSETTEKTRQQISLGNPQPFK